MDDVEPTRTIRWWWGEGQRHVMIDLHLPPDVDDETIDDFRGMLGIKDSIHSTHFLSEIPREFGERHGLAMRWQSPG
jgi:hypothetical protein